MTNNNIVEALAEVIEAQLGESWSGSLRASKAVLKAISEMPLDEAALENAEEACFNVACVDYEGYIICEKAEGIKQGLRAYINTAFKTGE